MRALCFSLIFLAFGSSAQAKKVDPLQIETMISSEIQENAPNLLKSHPKGVDRFCPRYKKFSSEMKLNFWTKLMGQITEIESNNSSTAVYHESLGGRLKSSYGLFRIPADVAKRNGCEAVNSKDLRTAEMNVRCGVKVMSSRVQKTNAITGKHIKDLWPSLDAKSARGKVFTKQATKVLKQDCGNIWAAEMNRQKEERLPASEEL